MLDDITDYLDTQLPTYTVGTNLFETFMPDKPDNCIMIKQTAGTVPNAYLPTHEYTFQVLIRNTDYEAGATVTAAVRAALHQHENFTQGNTYFYFVLLTGEGGNIGRDESGREVFSLNFRCRTR
jgi:hypothetical protein